MKFLVRTAGVAGLVMNLPFGPSVGDVLTVSDQDGCYVYKLRVLRVTHHLSMGHAPNCIYEDSVIECESLGFPD